MVILDKLCNHLFNSFFPLVVSFQQTWCVGLYCYIGNFISARFQTLAHSLRCISTKCANCCKTIVLWWTLETSIAHRTHKWLHTFANTNNRLLTFGENAILMEMHIYNLLFLSLYNVFLCLACHIFCCCFSHELGWIFGWVSEWVNNKIRLH